MAQYVVLPRQKKNVIIRCNRCGTMYVPDKGKHPFGDPDYYESCPMCGYTMNSKYQVIPLWKYNLIRYWRGLFDREQPDSGCTDD